MSKRIKLNDLDYEFDWNRDVETFIEENIDIYELKFAEEKWISEEEAHNRQVNLVALYYDEAIETMKELYFIFLMQS